jgi:hypothetical protein
MMDEGLNANGTSHSANMESYLVNPALATSTLVCLGLDLRIFYCLRHRFFKFRQRSPVLVVVFVASSALLLIYSFYMVIISLPKCADPGAVDCILMRTHVALYGAFLLCLQLLAFQAWIVPNVLRRPWALSNIHTVLALLGLTSAIEFGMYMLEFIHLKDAEWGTTAWAVGLIPLAVLNILLIFLPLLQRALSDDWGAPQRRNGKTKRGAATNGRRVKKGARGDRVSASLGDDRAWRDLSSPSIESDDLNASWAATEDDERPDTDADSDCDYEAEEKRELAFRRRRAASHRQAAAGQAGAYGTFAGGSADTIGPLVHGGSRSINSSFADAGGEDDVGGDYRDGYLQRFSPAPQGCGSYLWSCLLEPILLLPCYSCLKQNRRAREEADQLFYVLTHDELVDTDAAEDLGPTIESAELAELELVRSESTHSTYTGMYSGQRVIVESYLLLKDLRATPGHRIVPPAEQVRVLSALQHPNIITFFGTGLVSGVRFLALEAPANGTVKSLLDSLDAPLDLARLNSMALDTASGLAYLHSQRPPVVHRNVRPESLIIDASWTVKLGGFRSARRLTDDLYCEAAGVAPSGSAARPPPPRMGARGFMAPEMCTGGSRYGRTIDVFAFAISLWCMCTRERPYAEYDLVSELVRKGCGLCYFWCFAALVPCPAHTTFPYSFALLQERAVTDGVRPSIPSACPVEYVSLLQRAWHERPSRRPSFDQVGLGVVWTSGCSAKRTTLNKWFLLNHLFLSDCPGAARRAWASRSTAVRSTIACPTFCSAKHAVQRYVACQFAAWFLFFVHTLFPRLMVRTLAY